MRRVLIIVENLPSPSIDGSGRRPTLASDRGYQVSVICPVANKSDSRFEVLDGIHIYRHPLPLEASGAVRVSG